MQVVPKIGGRFLEGATRASLLPTTYLPYLPYLPFQGPYCLYPVEFHSGQQADNSLCCEQRAICGTNTDIRADAELAGRAIVPTNLGVFEETDPFCWSQHCEAR